MTAARPWPVAEPASVTRIRRPAICETRLGKPDDLAFVVDSWVKNDPELRGLRIRQSTRHVRTLLDVHDIPLHELTRELPRLLIAHVPGEVDAILGWAAIQTGTPGCVHYVYVRSAARKQGVARALVGETSVALEYSHAAPKGVAVPTTWTLNLKRAETT